MGFIANDVEVVGGRESEVVSGEVIGWEEYNILTIKSCLLSHTVCKQTHLPPYSPPTLSTPYLNIPTTTRSQYPPRRKQIQTLLAMHLYHVLNIRRQLGTLQLLQYYESTSTHPYVLYSFLVVSNLAASTNFTDGSTRMIR